MKKILFLIFILWFTISKGQICDSGKPVAFGKSILKKLSFETMPLIDVEKQIATDSLSQPDGCKALQFGVNFDVNLNCKNNGVWQILDNGNKLWRIGLNSANAYAMNVVFYRFDIPDGAKVFIYNSKQNFHIGAFTATNNNYSNSFSTAFIPGDSIVVEYEEPADAEFNGNLIIGRIGHDYKGIFKDGQFGQSGSCNIDIVCPQGANWQNEKHAVCRFFFPSVTGTSTYMCSGSMVNNTLGDGTPYFLTANHCLTTATQAENAVFYFNYESPTCNGSDGSTNQTISGAILHANSPLAKLDFSLVELSTRPPASYSAYYAGWDVHDVAATTSVCIHHPEGDVKKISTNANPVSTANFGESFDLNSHWYITRWASGVTEGGSSGSPLFDQNHHIVGTLTGGSSSCGSPIDDYFSKVSRAWKDYNCLALQLQGWLDPLSSGLQTLDGYYLPALNNDAQLSSISSPLLTFLTAGYQNFTINVKNTGTKIITDIQIQYTVDSTSNTFDWTGSLTANNTISITLDDINLTEGNHQVFANIVTVNGVADDNFKNNYQKKDIYVGTTDAQLIQLNLQTDMLGNETTWQVKDVNNNIVLTGGPYYAHSLQNINEKFYLKQGCYTFTIFDSGNNGINNCNTGTGFYNLTNATINQAIAGGGTFTSSDSVKFCLYKVGIEHIDYNTNIDVYPNPAQNQFFVETFNFVADKIYLFDISGRLISTVKPSSQKSTITTSQLPAGIYFVGIEYLGKMYHKKIVVIN